jgi:hypothetical protein
MSGRPNKKAYLYDYNGKYLRTFNSCSEASQYFLGFKKALFVYKDYELFNEGVLVPTRIGRNNIVRLLIRHHDNLVIRNSDLTRGVVGLFNVDHEKIAEFISIRIASIITGDSEQEITGSILNRTTAVIPKENNNGLRFYYKFI